MGRIGRDFIAAALVAGGVSLAAFGRSDPFQPEIAEKIIRFHVLADSDSKEDQQLKLLVRDSVGALMEPRLAASSGIKETREIIEASIPDIVETAEQTLQENGSGDKVTARLTHTDFPVKSYGSYTFPEGNYEALQVTIGAGKGHNWWCVLYPNMCFQDSVYEVDKQSGEVLKEVLSPEEYEDVFRNGNYEVHSKLLDFLKSHCDFDGTDI